MRARTGAACALVLAACAALAGCGGGSGNDPVAREALVQASLKSAAADSYVATVAAGKRAPVRFTYVAPDRLRVQQGDGKNAVVVVQVALNGYHSSPGRPGQFTKKLEDVTASDNAPLKAVSSLIAQSEHVSRHGNAIRFTVPYGDVDGRLLIDLDSQGRIADADLPVFDDARKVVSYRRVSFDDYGSAPPVEVPAAGTIAGG